MYHIIKDWQPSFASDVEGFRRPCNFENETVPDRAETLKVMWPKAYKSKAFAIDRLIILENSMLWNPVSSLQK